MSHHLRSLWIFFRTGLFVLLTMVPLWFLYSYSNILSCFLIDYSSFLKYQERIYVSPSLTKTEQQRIPYLIARSQRRLIRTWKILEGSPTFIVCATEQEYEKYCKSKDGAGCSLGTPFGYSYIILSPSGINIDVISHEMCHDELLARVGWRKATFHIPQWFHEGLALMYDRRFVATSQPLQRFLSYRQQWQQYNAINPIPLSELHTLNGFFNQSPLHTQKAYLTAGTEVSFWLLLSGNDGIFHLIDALKKDEAFKDAYTRIEVTSDTLQVRLKNPVRNGYLE